jgi:hypothetical protein
VRHWIPYFDFQERFWHRIHLVKLGKVNFDGKQNAWMILLTVCGLPAIRAISEKVIRCDESLLAKGE